MPGLPLVSAQRIDVTRITLSGGVAAYREHTKPIEGMPAGSLLGAFLKLDGSGGTSLAVNGAVTEALFWVAAGASLLTTIKRISITLGDAAILEEGFGGLAALTNGIALEVYDPTIATPAVIADLTGGAGLKSHADLLAFGADLRFVGSTLVAAAWDLPTPIELVAGQYLRARVRDDLTGLTRATIFVAGETRTSA